MARILRANVPDYVFITAVAFLTMFGLVALASASSELGKAKFDDTLFYIKHQLSSGLIIGIIGFCAAYVVPLAYFRKASIALLLGTVVALILVFTPLGFSAGGATRWLSIGGVTFQPAEILKFTFVIYLAAWLSGDLRKRSSSLEGFIPFLVLCGTVAALLIFQPTTSTVVIVLGAGMMMYFAGGGRVAFIAGAGALGIVALAVLIALSPYRLARVMTYINPTADLFGAGFQRNQALIALGSGGAFGVGYGNSVAKFNYLPEPLSDSIFAVIGEEFGFAGSLVLISMFLVLITRMFSIAKQTPDRFGKLVVIGVAGTVAIQAFMNMGALSGFLPLTGVPLPFVSYGGTALAIVLTSMGLVAQISRYSTANA
jgi:cell division protein FtsW